MKKHFLFAALAALLMASCGDESWLRIKRPKFDPIETGSRNDSIEEDVDFNDPLVPDECTANEPDDIPEEVVAVEEEETSYIVRATVYNPEPSQCCGDPLVTASRQHIDIQKLKAGDLRWIAVSRDLLDIYHYGDTLDVFISENHPFNGQWVVQDTMNKRYRSSIDFLTYNTRNGKWDAIVTKV